MQNKTKQKNPVAKLKLKDQSVVELIKANSLLSQNCINLSNHLTKCEMDISSLYHQNLFLKHEIGDLHGMMEAVAAKIGMDKEMFEKPVDSAPKKKAEKIEKAEKEQKALPLHDDITVRCPTCKALNHRDSKSCAECGQK